MSVEKDDKTIIDRQDQVTYDRDLTIIGESIDHRDSGDIKDPFYTHDYSLRGTVGKGGVGRVLLGFDRRVGREVAIKELLNIKNKKGGFSTISSRFMREAKITGRLEHPGIVPVYEIGEKPDGTQFYVMKYVRGNTLTKALSLCESGSKEEALKKRLQLLENLIDACEAMAYSHSKGVVHRDLKPGNIVLGAFGETIILDWGLAKTSEDARDGKNLTSVDIENIEEENSDLTRVGEILGTPSYMAPEQVSSSFGDVDTRSDVFALGAILHQILTGNTPYSGKPKRILKKLISSDPVPVGDKSLDLPAELLAICKKALQKDKEKRFLDAAEMAKELKAYRDGRMVSVHAYSKKELLVRFLRKNKAFVIAGLAVVLAIIIGAGFSINFGIKAHKARIEAELAKGRAENALTEVTLKGNSALDLAGRVTAGVNVYIDTVREGMLKKAELLSAYDLSDEAKIDPHLEALFNQFPSVANFLTIKTPGVIASVWPDKYNNVIGLDISNQDHIKQIFKTSEPVFSRVFKAVEGFYAVTLQVPIMKNGKTVGSLAAVLKPAEFVPSVMDFDAKEQDAVVWFMQDDGYILYDPDPNEVGKFLFRDEIFSDYPELLEFGRQVQVKDFGVGHYSFFAKDNKKRSIHKIAAWDSIYPSTNTSWKAVVVKKYIEK